MKRTAAALSALLLPLGCPAEDAVVADATPEPIRFDDARGIFSVFGDIPYSEQEEGQLAAIIASHNEVPEPTFLVHVGDIRSQGLGLCRESHYTRVAELLRPSRVPVFILPGDNEWNDCADPDDAWGWWTASFAAFDANWDFGPAVTRQEGREENWAFEQEGVLFVGINLVGGTVHDEAEWAERLVADADWVDANLASHPDVDAFVLLGHANPSDDHQAFMDRFVPAAEAFQRPVLFVHGDGHGWIDDVPWDAPNLRRIQIEAGSVPPVLVGYDPAQSPVFITNRALFPVD